MCAQIQLASAVMDDTLTRYRMLSTFLTVSLIH